jgi:hypothetical protein
MKPVPPRIAWGGTARLAAFLWIALVAGVVILAIAYIAVASWPAFARFP